MAAGAKEGEESSHGGRKEEHTQGDGGGVEMKTQHRPSKNSDWTRDGHGVGTKNRFLPVSAHGWEGNANSSVNTNHAFLTGLVLWGRNC